MTRLTVAARNLAAIIPGIQSKVADGSIGSDSVWTDGWIFSDKPYANIEKKSHTALIVISPGGNWQAPNQYNTSRFPLMYIDIWASPTRGTNFSPVRPDADTLIEEVFDVLFPYFHTVNQDVPGIASDPDLPYLGKPGFPRVWGTADEISSRTGVTIVGSQLLLEPEFADVEDGNGARFARFSFGVQTV
jgi:hypothetical protein